MEWVKAVAKTLLYYVYSSFFAFYAQCIPPHTLKHKYRTQKLSVDVVALSNTIGIYVLILSEQFHWEEKLNVLLNDFLLSVHIFKTLFILIKNDLIKIFPIYIHFTTIASFSMFSQIISLFNVPLLRIKQTGFIHGYLRRSD